MGGYSSQELMAIFVMQGFSGLSLFCVFLLMALGLAIIFGQMGVINMAQYQKKQKKMNQKKEGKKSGINEQS